MSTEQKRKELEAAGYVIDSWIFFDDGGAPCVESPDGIMFGHNEDEKHLAIDKAYEHLQRDQELVALRKYVKEIYDESEKIKEFSGKWSDPIESTFANLLMVAYRSWAYIKQFNITADDESDNE